MTGSSHASASCGWCLTVQRTTPACAGPIACVFVIAIGPDIVPDSSIQETPVISPLPLREWKPAAHGSPGRSRPRGWIAVTPVRTLSPAMSVAYPTSTPGTSVIAFAGPGRPANDSPSARARGLPDGVARCGSLKRLVLLVVEDRVLQVPGAAPLRPDDDGPVGESDQHGDPGYLERGARLLGGDIDERRDRQQRRPRPERHSVGAVIGGPRRAADE